MDEDRALAAAQKQFDAIAEQANALPLSTLDCDDEAWGFDRDRMTGMRADWEQTLRHLDLIYALGNKSESE